MAHAIGDKVRQAYDDSALLDERRKFMVACCMYSSNNNTKKNHIDSIIESLSPYQKHGFRDGDGFKVACPFCRDAQKNDSKRREKCSSICPVVGSFSYFFSCNRGLNGGKGNQQCSHAMRFSTLLKLWNPPLYCKYTREKEVAKQFGPQG